MTSKFMMILAAYLHVLGVASYLWGALTMEFVLSPAQKFVPPAQAQVIGQKSADRFLVMAWSALGLIAFSGVLRMFTLGSQKVLTTFDGSYGGTLFVMIVLWAVLVVNGCIITFGLRPKLTTRAEGGVAAADMAARQQAMVNAAQWVTRLTRADLVIALLVGLLGAALGLGGLF